MEKPKTFVGLALLLLLVQSFLEVSGRDEDICHLFSNNTVIRDPDSCGQSITCIDTVSHYSTCAGSTPFFDKDTGKCVKALSDDSSCAVSCEDSVSQFVADPKSCYGYYYCSDEETAQYGKCPTDTHFNATTQTCTRLNGSACTASSFEYCHIVKNSVNFNNLQGCNKYHVCEKGVLKDKTCSSSSYYQASTGTCVAKALVDCDAHPLPSNVCGTVKKPLENKFVTDGASCRGYFYCGSKQEDGTPDANPTWNQCPQDRFFDASSQTCKTPTAVACKWDRCEGRTPTFVTAATTGCRNYLICSDGHTQAEKSCGNYFFDETQGACVPEVLSYAACKGK